MKAVVLDFDSLQPASLNTTALHQLPLDWTLYGHTSSAQLAERIRQADIILTNKVMLSAEALRHSPCRYIGILATGTNNVDLAYCQANQITVNNVTNYGTGSVVQHALMMLLNLMTAFRQYDDAVRHGRWSQAKHFCLLDYPITELAGKHAVLVGSGTLGSAFGKVLTSLGMTVTFCARPGADDDTRPSLDALLPDADVLSLHCPLTPATDTLIDATRLARLKPGAVLINTARGGLLDETALLEALTAGTLAGAALDVLSQEPPPADHPLLNSDLPQLIITPHAAWGATESRQRLLDQALTKLTDFIAGG